MTIYVIDTAAGQDIPRKRGPGLARSDLLVVNKTDLAPHVGVDAGLLEADARAARSGRAVIMASLRQGKGVDGIVDFLVSQGGLRPLPDTTCTLDGQSAAAAAPKPPKADIDR